MIYIFNSIGFILFFILTFVIYWLLPMKLKNILLLIASYVFYATWNLKLLGLLLISTLLNYFFGVGIEAQKNPRLRKLCFLSGIIFNLSFLGYFKYLNFFVENLVELFNLIGFHLDFATLNIILPLGVSFYTFKMISYLIDIYLKKVSPTKNIIDFSLFVAYFPSLISGPIERAGKLVPEIQSEKLFRDINFREGAYLFAYGFFKKAVIADSIASIVNNVFTLQNASSAQILLGSYSFAIQLYCDFSGYIDMARGISHFFGIRLSPNFNIPYFAETPPDFWRRWHITLSSWVRDYIYIPLGGKNSRFFGVYPLFVSWLVMGLWHGAAWNFILWGVYWFIIILAYRIIKDIFKNFHSSQNQNKPMRIFRKIVLITLTFHLIVYGWILFRAQSLSQAVAFTRSLALGINLIELFDMSHIYLYTIILFLVIYETLQYCHNDPLFINKKGFYYQLFFYLALFFMYVQIGSVSDVRFFYFQF